MYSLIAVISANLTVYFYSLPHSSLHQIFPSLPYHSHTYSLSLSSFTPILSFFLPNIISYESLASHTDFSALTDFSNFLISCIKVKSIIRYDSIYSFGLFIEQTFLTIIAVFCLTLWNISKWLPSFLLFPSSSFHQSSFILHVSSVPGAPDRDWELSTLGIVGMQTKSFDSTMLSLNHHQSFIQVGSDGNFLLNQVSS